MIKLFVSDMDGTLLNGNHEISSRNAEAIRALQSNGVEFMIATGRTIFGTLPLLQQHDLTAHLVNLNGAAIYDEHHRLTASLPMHHPTVEEIFNFAETYQLDYSILTDTKSYVLDVDKYIENLKRFIPLPSKDNALSSGHFFEGINDFVRPLSTFNFDGEEQILKLMIYGPNNTSSLARLRSHFDSFSEVDITSSAFDNLEITNAHAQKGLAVEAFAKQHGYTMDEVATIGDSLNDRSMLRMAKYSYAMENAPDEVKAMARYAAPTNTEDGVAIVIERLLREMNAS